MGILEMDFERILGVPFFHSSSHSIMLCNISKLNYHEVNSDEDFVFDPISIID